MKTELTLTPDEITAAVSAYVNNKTGHRVTNVRFMVERIPLSPPVLTLYAEIEPRK